MTNLNIKVLENRLIAFLDVFGFRERVKRETHWNLWAVH